MDHGLLPLSTVERGEPGGWMKIPGKGIAKYLGFWWKGSWGNSGKSGRLSWHQEVKEARFLSGQLKKRPNSRRERENPNR